MTIRACRARGCASCSPSRATRAERHGEHLPLGDAQLDAATDESGSRLDEAHDRRGHELATVVSDVDQRRVIEVVAGRSRRTVERYLRSLPGERQAIEVVSIDPYEAYRLAIQTVLPDAVIVCDPFHLIRGANTALDTIRRERQRLAHGERGKGARRAGRTIWKRDLPAPATPC